MSLLTTLLSFLVKDVQSTIISILVGLATLLILYLIKFYTGLSKYPNGPIPLPLIGNMRLFKGRVIHEVFEELTLKYGPVYTIWLGWQPIVILGKNDVILEAFIAKKNDFAGRPEFFFAHMNRVSENSSDVIMEDWGRPWEVLRRVSHTAARKFAVNPKLPNLEVAVVDEVVELILSKEGLNNPFDLQDYIYLMVYSTLASIAAGKSYSINDTEFQKLKSANETVFEVQSTLAVVEFLPFMRFYYAKNWKRMVGSIKTMLDWVNVQMDTHLSNHENGIDNKGEESIKDFCDALIDAKREAEESDSQAAPHLTPDNLKNVLNNLFQAGTDTTRMTLRWVFLLLANFPDVQDKLRVEIDQVIGSEVPTNDHRIKCHYVQAFIAEVMRFSPIASGGVPHKAIVDAEVAGHPVPKGTTVVASVYSQLYDAYVWGDPEVFRPERFLDPKNSGNFNARINDANHPFGVGRRACLGEKLALMNLFILITRFLQKTTGHRIVLKDGVGSVSLKPDPIQPFQYTTVPYKIMIVKV